jgi:ribosomal protein S18 acetylase RimI-like enzyme
VQNSKFTIRLLESKDIPQIAAAFAKLGWHKPASQYEQYLLEQKLNRRDVYVAFIEDQFAGYVTICWITTYEPFSSANIPEIVDFNVLPEFRRQHIGTALMDKAESEIGKVSRIAGIGVGMTADYGAAQRMYVLRGYIPDGHGLHQKDHPLHYGEQFTVDDDLALYFTKELK